MILVQRPLLYPRPAISRRQFREHLTSLPSPRALLCSSSFPSKFSAKITVKCFCQKIETTHEASPQGFSALSEDIPWDEGSVWSTMAFYMFSLHIPLSFGSLPFITQLFNEPVLDPQTKALCVLAAQSFEFLGALLLLKFTAKPQYRSRTFLGANKSSKERSWLLSSAMGIGFLFILVFFTSFLADRVVGHKAVNDPILKEILASSNISKMSCFLVYCVVTPILEETVYRGFLLTSMASTMKWQHAVLISSVVFSAAHLSAENSLQLFIIGCVLGSSYCWSGNLNSSILIHSLYNAITLLITFLL